MPSIKKTFFLISFLTGLLLITNQGIAQISDEIILSLKSGNSKVLSSYFNQNVELGVPENDNVYSKAQAQLIINNFFTSYPPQNFSVIHQGGKEGARYVIGTLTTQKGNFRVYFYLKKSDGKEYIHQLKIEKQE